MSASQKEQQEREANRARTATEKKRFRNKKATEPEKRSQVLFSPRHNEESQKRGTATKHANRSHASILRCSDSAVEQDASTEHISKARLSTSDDVTLIAILEHFANCYVAMPMVGTCRRIFITWTRKRRQLALEELTNLRCWLHERGLRGIGRVDGFGNLICDIYLALWEIDALIR